MSISRPLSSRCLSALSLVRSEVSIMRLPTLTMRPPMIAGSTLTSRSTSLPPVTDLSASLSASRCSSLSGSATVTSAVTSPLWRATSARIGADHVAHREQAAVGGDELQEIGGEPADAGLVEDRRRAPAAARRRRTPGCAPAASRSGLSRDQRVEPVEIGPDGVERLVVERQLEQRGGVAARHAGNDRVFACHGTLVLLTSFTGRTPSRIGGANCWNSRGNSDSGDVAEARGNPLKSRAS